MQSPQRDIQKPQYNSHHLFKNLNELVLERHVILRFKPDARAHDVDQRTALLG